MNKNPEQVRTAKGVSFITQGNVTTASLSFGNAHGSHRS